MRLNQLNLTMEYLLPPASILIISEATSLRLDPFMVYVSEDLLRLFITFHNCNQPISLDGFSAYIFKRPIVKIAQGKIQKENTNWPI